MCNLPFFFGVNTKTTTNAFPWSLEGARCLNSSDLSFLPAAAGQTLTCSTNPAWLMFFTSVKWERSRRAADYLAPKGTEAYSAAKREESLQTCFHLKATMRRFSSYLGMKWLLFSLQNGWSVQEALLSLWKPKIPIGGGCSALLREVSLSLNWGGGGKEEERSEGIEDAGKLPSGAGVCQQQAAPVHTVGKCGPAWAGPGRRKTNQAYNGKYMDRRGGVCLCACVCACVWLCIHADYKCTLSCKHGVLRHFWNFKCTTTSKKNRNLVFISLK